MPVIPRCLNALTACACGLSLLAFFALQSEAQANQSNSFRADLASLPDAPQALGQQPPPPAGQTPGSPSAAAPAPSAPQDSTGPKQTKRILGIMPNFNAVSADTKLPPQSPKEKF